MSESEKAPARVGNKRTNGKFFVHSRQISNQLKLFDNSTDPPMSLTQQTAPINYCTKELQTIRAKASTSKPYQTSCDSVQTLSLSSSLFHCSPPLSLSQCIIIIIIYLLWPLFWCSHFEDSVIGTFTENSSIEYSISSSDSNAITGAPVSYQDNSDISNNFLANSIDFGEFMDSTADVYPEKLKHAVCGKLTIKYV